MGYMVYGVAKSWTRLRRLSTHARGDGCGLELRVALWSRLEIRLDWDGFGVRNGMGHCAGVLGVGRWLKLCLVTGYVLELRVRLGEKLALERKLEV